MISETETDYTDRPSTQSTQSKSQLTSRIMNGSQYQRKVVHQMTLGDSQSEVFCAKFDPEDKYIACGYGDGVARIYNLQTGKLSFQLSGSLQLAGSIDDMPITALKWRPQSAQLKTMNVLVTAQADGSLKHWHSTSGKCLHSRLDNPDNHLYCLDFNPEGTLLAAAGRDCHVRIYDETTKSLAVTMKERGDLPGHSNRVFCVKFNPIQRDMVVSGGWDNTLQIYDIRQKGPVESIYGPHICGDSLDFRNDGYTLLAGSYRQDDAIQLFDLRKFKCVRTYEWDGPDGMGIAQREPEESVRMQQFRPKTAPLLYATMFNKTQDLILAGGAGKNQVRIFDYESGNIISIISDMERSILCMDVNKTKNGFAFGSADSCVRILDIQQQN